MITINQTIIKFNKDIIKGHTNGVEWYMVIDGVYVPENLLDYIRPIQEVEFEIGLNYYNGGWVYQQDTELEKSILKSIKEHYDINKSEINSLIGAYIEEELS